MMLRTIATAAAIATIAVASDASAREPMTGRDLLELCIGGAAEEVTCGAYIAGAFDVLVAAGLICAPDVDGYSVGRIVGKRLAQDPGQLDLPAALLIAAALAPELGCSR